MKTYIDNFPPYSRNTSCDLRKQTNADRFRSMADEELAELILGFVIYFLKTLASEYHSKEEILEELKNWLKQETET